MYKALWYVLWRAFIVIIIIISVIIIIIIIIIIITAHNSGKPKLHTFSPSLT